MKTRIISGAVALLLLAAILIIRATFVFNVAFGLIGALMVYELIKAEKLEKEYPILFISAIYAFVSPLLVYLTPVVTTMPSGGFLFADSLIHMMLTLSPYIAASFVYIVSMTLVLLIKHKQITLGAFYTCALYSLLITLSMTAICAMPKLFGGISLGFLIITFMGSWIADSGAYFVGTFFGKHKLCPEISPKKTVEGLIGGAVTNAVSFAIATVILNKIISTSGAGALNPFIMAVVGVICCFLGLLGDLTASLIKRDCGIKDYGNIMPGHGGAMDRFDSVVYVAPFMLVIFTIGSGVITL